MSVIDQTTENRVTTAALAMGRPFAYLSHMALDFRADPKAKRLLPLQVRAPDIEEWLLERDPTAIGSWKEMGREEYARAFTAAQTAGFDIINDIYFGIVDTVARNGTEADFAKLVVPILKEKGWMDGDDRAISSRVRLIYDTNLRLARAAGRWSHYQAGKATAPYLRAFTVGDDRVRHPPKSPHADHRAWDGIILPVDHDFWRVYWPPLGFRCRCSVVQMTRSQLARYRGGITSEEELQDRIARLGEPVFMAPTMPIAAQLAAMVERSNNPPPRKSTGWTVDGVSGLSAEQANARIEAGRTRVPGLPRINPVETARKGGDEFDAILRASSLKDISRQLALMGF